MIEKLNAKNGFYISIFVLLALIFLPPVFVSSFEVWEIAHTLSSKNQDIVRACGKENQVNLSRWFYSYKFSGETASAKFRGTVKSKQCKRKFSVELRMDRGSWVVSNLVL